MSFRKDINALRAISVIAIMVVHFYPNSLPGAFAAVDIFFVISGYLITGIIVKKLREKEFSLISFYFSRIKRIIPALSFLCFFLIIVGWHQFSQKEFLEVAKHVIGAMTFTSNFMFWQESGYFDTASKQKWLLHTWSLSNQWQFYLLFPLVLIFLNKLKSLNLIKFIVVVITVLSFLFCLFLGSYFPEANFYLIVSRLWEFTIGSCVWLFFYNRKAYNNRWLQWMGLLLILASFLFLNTDNNWPSLLTLFPICGALLVIIANRSEQSFLCNYCVQKIGSSSYSIYIWHWPLVVWLNSFTDKTYIALLGIFLSIAIGLISYELFEKRRKLERNANLNDFLISKSIHMALITFIVAFLVYVNKGYASRFDNDKNIEELIQNRDHAEEIYRQSWFKIDDNKFISLCSLDNFRVKLDETLNCLGKGFKTDGFLIIGGSHAREFQTALSIAYPNTKFTMLYQSSCAPTTYTLSVSAEHYCFEKLDKINQMFIQKNEKIRGIIFASAFLHESGFNLFLKNIKENMYGDLPIYMANIGPMLNVPIVEMALKAGKVQSSFQLGSSNDIAMTRNKKIQELQDRVKLFDKHALFCDGDLCDLIENNYPYFWDTSHLTPLGIDKMAKAVKEQNFLFE